MSVYYVNIDPQSDGQHEVHKSECTHLASREDRLYLGIFRNCQDAIQEAEKHYPAVAACNSCSPECCTE